MGVGASGGQGGGSREIESTIKEEGLEMGLEATAEQIRLAQMIYDKNDTDFEDKVKQLMEVTGKNQDESIVALHDCNGDVNRAINVLLEGNSDTTSWETVGKKKNLGTGKDSLLENKENREKRGDREASRGRGSSSRRGKGNRGKECKSERPGFDSQQGKALAKFPYSPSLTIIPQEKETIIICIDLATLLQKPSSTGTVTETNSYEAPQQANLTQSLVFTNSRHDDPIPSVEGNSNAVNSYSQSLSSVLGSGFGELGTTKMANSSGSQLLEQLKSSGLVPLAAQNNQQSNTPAWETKSTLQSTVLSQFDFKTQPEPSPVLSQLTQRQQQASVQPVLDSFSSQIKLQDPSPVESTVTKMIQQPPVSADNQMANVQQSQQKQVKPQKRKIPPSSKIPASAVEMPGSADVSGLNVQFGALEFGSEPSLPDFGTGGKETISQTQNHLFSNSVRRVPKSTSFLCQSGNPKSPPLPNVASLSSSVSAASSLLPSVSQHSAGLSSLNQTNELSSSALSQLSRYVTNERCTKYSKLYLLFTFLLEYAELLALLSGARKAPPNLPQGVPPLLHNQYIVGPGGLLPAYPIYGYDDLQMLQSRLPMDYYGMAFPAPAATLAGRDGSLANNPYSGDLTKFGRGDTASPAPATTLAQPQQNQTQAHHTTQQAFLNPALPPGYSYTGLPYYTGVPGVPSTFQYGPAMFVPPASAKQHGVNMNTASTPFQQAGGYGQHGYGTGYDDLNQGGGAGDYSKGGYSGSTQAQTKSAGPGKGVSVTSTNAGVPDITGSVYNKAQSFDKQGFHAGTPAAFNLPSALAGTGPLNPAAAPGYAPAPFLHIVPAHQQPHSQLLHHHLQQDGQGGSGQRNQQSSIQQKSQANKPNYGSSPYWGN
uniref:Ubiquitin associated protein 2a n=1 Tax=Callorhinchus milii TaxID=7868 RepID=A0A4W3IB66_CALMI